MGPDWDADDLNDLEDLTILLRTPRKRKPTLDVVREEQRFFGLRLNNARVWKANWLAMQ